MCLQGAERKAMWDGNTAKAPETVKEGGGEKTACLFLAAFDRSMRSRGDRHAVEFQEEYIVRLDLNTAFLFQATQ